VFDRYIREHAKLLDVGAAHRIGRSVIENVYDRGGARRFLNSLLESLVAEGFLEKRNSGFFLTEKGLYRIYPGGESQAIDEVKADMLEFFRSSNARAGHALAIRSFFAQYAMKYSPPKKRAIEKAAAGLVNDGTLEERDGGHFLTPAGYSRIYAA
ncbi:hypothetical protein, partial [Rhodanobacter sp. C06]|uniref:hypothetical protein n=1 Tax=Rhodanobacter sp. C06 TaxID=1945854 RepID=UPI0014386FD0